MRSPFFSLLSLLVVAQVGMAQQRIVLIEQFTNSSCPPCGAVSPSVYAYANASGGQAVVIAYHTLFPYNNDSMYFENTVEATQRVNHYMVESVPYSVMDGNIYSGSSNPFAYGIAGYVGNRLAVPSQYSIDVGNLLLNGGVLSGSLQFVSTHSNNVALNLVAHVVVIEKNVLKSAYAASPGANTETEYGYVMRKMLPDASGTSLLNTGLGQSTPLAINWQLAKIKDVSQLRVVAFVQNAATREVLQAAIFEPVGLTQGLTNQPHMAEIDCQLFPNPSHGQVQLQFSQAVELRYLEVLDQLGGTVFTQPVGSALDHISFAPGLPAGVYTLRIVTASVMLCKRLLIGE